MKPLMIDVPVRLKILSESEYKTHRMIFISSSTDETILWQQLMLWVRDLGEQVIPDFSLTEKIYLSMSFLLTLLTRWHVDNLQELAKKLSVAMEKSKE